MRKVLFVACSLVIVSSLAACSSDESKDGGTAGSGGAGVGGSGGSGVGGTSGGAGMAGSGASAGTAGSGASAGTAGSGASAGAAGSGAAGAAGSGELGIDCNAPAIPPTGGSCVTLGGAIECNPVTNDGCDSSAGEACGFNFGFSGYRCWGGLNAQSICAECSDSAGPYCAAGLTCTAPSTTAPFACTKFCCDDTDCGAHGHCEDVGLPGGVGYCLTSS